MHDQQITYLSSNRWRTHMVRFLCCFAVKIASKIEVCAYLSSAIFCRYVWHGSTISSADFLRKLSHAHKSWPTLSIVWLLLHTTVWASNYHIVITLPPQCDIAGSLFDNRCSLYIAVANPRGLGPCPPEATQTVITNDDGQNANYRNTEIVLEH